MLLPGVILVLFYLLTPWLILFLCHRFKFVNKIGSVVIAYIVGLIVGNLGVIPEDLSGVQEWVANITVPMAIPLMLFSTNIREWLGMAGKTMLTLLTGLLAVVLVVIIGFFILKHTSGDEIWKVSGMLVGVYSGGTPNLASLKMMLDVDPNTYILTHTYDMLLSSIYLVFLMTIGQRFFKLFLKPFEYHKPDDNVLKEFDGVDPFYGMLKKRNTVPLAKALGLSVAIFGIGGGFSLLFPQENQVVVTILTITTLGILASLLPQVNRINKSFELGMFFILIFSVDVASMADLQSFSSVSHGLFIYITIAVFGSLTLHVIFSRLFNIDTDTLMITSTALICSPPFVPVVAGALKNRKIVVSGLTVGIIGYAVGNYLGYLIAQLLKMF